MFKQQELMNRVMFEKCYCWILQSPYINAKEGKRFYIPMYIICSSMYIFIPTKIMEFFSIKNPILSIQQWKQKLIETCILL